MSYGSTARRAVMRRGIVAGRSVDRAPAELLLPEYIVLYATALTKRHGEWRDLIVFLVQRYRSRVLSVAHRAENLRFTYQSDGLNLRRVSYLPYRDMRAELRMLSYAARISMCALVVMMLEWERESEARGAEVHEVTMSFQSSWRLKGGFLTVSAEIRLHAGPPEPPA